MKKIEARYMKAYVDYTDTSDGPSSLGTVSDYNRMLMEVFSDIEDEYPEIEDHYDEINKRLEELTMELARGRK